MDSFQITDYCHRLAETFGGEPELCVDATMGNGSDTLFLCRLTGKNGRVAAFDIQEGALANTRELLEKEGCLDKAELILDSHENIRDHLTDESADIIMFNFGYLPGGDHSIRTEAESSLRALEESLKVLRKGGIMVLCLYSGKDMGGEEKKRILEFLKSLDPKRYLVITHEYANRPNDPPLPVLVKKF